MNKIFAIGFNKTGTESLLTLMKSEGYIVCPKEPFEASFDFFLKNDFNFFKKMLDTEYNSYEFYKDVPFSLPRFYRFLDESYPTSNFILTTRNTSDEWYNSTVNFHKKLFSNSIQNPKKIKYIREGWIYDLLTKVYGAPEQNPYDKEILINCYEKHNSDVIEYFKGTNKLLVINVSDMEAVNDLSKFLGREFKTKLFPHVNKTKE